MRTLVGGSPWEAVRTEVREIAWLLSMVAVLSVGGAGIGVVSALIFGAWSFVP
jgi:hypothetical protein